MTYGTELLGTAAKGPFTIYTLAICNATSFAETAVLNGSAHVMAW